MTDLWLPPRVSKEYRESTQRLHADLREQFWFRGPVAAAWNPELQKLDPYLRLGQAKEGASHAGVIPGYWHLLRLNPSAPWSVMPLQGPQGEFVEPTSRMLETLRANDLQNARVVADRERADRLAELAREREQQNAHEERVGEMSERWRAVTETSVSMSDAAPWTQNTKGRRAA